ncbi:MAG: hypothetical protein GXP47_05140 [Acidobacteria bacterium]|nr:hypothetical protein [Acidobacteriota bacterium]
MGRITEWGQAGRSRRFSWKRWSGVLLGLALAVGTARGAGLLWHRLHELRWIDGDLQQGLKVAKRENKKLLVLFTGDW